MKDPDSKDRVTRRQFLARAIAVGAVAASARTSLAASMGRQPNPFGYDVEQLSRTDPKWLHYEELSRFKCHHPEPRRIAMDAQGRLYVAGGDNISILDRSGGLVRDLSLSGKARCVGVAADGTVFGGLRDKVEVFDAKWQKHASWEAPGKKVWLTGIAVGEKDVFVADSGGRVVLRYDHSGKLLGRLGEKDKDRNVPGLIVPSPYLDVDLGTDGLVRVNNPGRHRVELYTADGDLELTWGKPGMAIDGFCGCCNPVAIAMLPDGRCITCEKGLPRAKVFSPDGTFECVVAGTESFPQNARASVARDLSDGTMGGLDAVADAKGQVYLLDIVAAEIHVLARKPKV